MRQETQESGDYTGSVLTLELAWDRWDQDK